MTKSGLIATLDRIMTGDQGTRGVFSLESYTWVSLELPWRLNLPNVSCIPPGEYQVIWSKSPKFRRFTYEIINVPGRGGIRIHSGTYAGDVQKGFKSHSQGCPLLGRYLGTSNQLMLLRSRDATMEFEGVGNRRPFRLLVRQGIGGK